MFTKELDRLGKTIFKVSKTLIKEVIKYNKNKRIQNYGKWINNGTGIATSH